MAVEKHVAGGQRCSDWAACNERQGIAPPPAAAQPEAQRAFDRQPDAHAAFAAEGDGELTACSVVEAVRWREATDTEWWLDNDDAIARVERYAQQQLERFHATFGEPKALRAEIAARDADLAKLATAIRQANAADTAGHLIADMDPLAYVVSVLDGEHGPAAPSRDEPTLRRAAEQARIAIDRFRDARSTGALLPLWAAGDALSQALADPPDSSAGMAEGATGHLAEQLTQALVRMNTAEAERDAARAELAEERRWHEMLRAQCDELSERHRSACHALTGRYVPPAALGAGPREGED